MSHVRSPRPYDSETDGVSGPARNLRTLASGQSPASGLTEDFYGNPHYRDFEFRGSREDKVQPLQLAADETFTVVDAIVIANRARALQARELRRLFAAAVAWATNGAVRWTARNRRHRHLGKLSDHLLRDIGLRRDQIKDVLSGYAKRGKGQ